MIDDEDDLASFLEEDNDEDDLASFLEEDEDDDNDDLESFLEDDENDDDDLAAFLEDEDEDDDEDDDDDTAEDDFGDLANFIPSKKPQPLLPFKKDPRKAKLDITKNSKEDHRTIMRYTKKEVEDQLKRDYKYMLSKPYMMIRPVTIMADYPYKKKSSDSDIMNDKNIDEDYVIVIGKILKWRGTEEFKGKPYKLGHIMYVKRGEYWVNGKIMKLDPHFAIVLKKSYKRIKSKRIRDLFKPLKQRLRTGKPFGIYKDFPIIIKRLGAFS